MVAKFYQNPQRTAADAQPVSYQPYVPQYRIHGIEPDQTYAMNDRRPQSKAPHQAILVKGNPAMFDTKPTKHIGHNVPFADGPRPSVQPSAQATTHSSNIPNIGNNVENTWASMDGVIDDVGLDYDNTPMIDNNNYVDLRENTQVTPPMAEEPSLPISLQDDEYLLAFGDNIIATGPIQFIEQEVKDLIFGDHQLCEGKSIPADELMVLKRVKIKVGVFING